MRNRQVTSYEDFLGHLPTICVGQAASLKIDGPKGRIWLNRVTDEVEYERLVGGRWIDTTEEGDPFSVDLRCNARHHHRRHVFCVECGGWG